MKPGERTEFVWLQSSEPGSLFCADETEVDTLRACAQVVEPLLRYEIGSGEITEGIAETWTPNDDASIWTFRLRDGVKFHDGSDLDATDVVRTFAMHWDASHPLHVGEFEGFRTMFGAFIGTDGIGESG
jgi:ABC-type transport system substrate-binding protein